MLAIFHFVKQQQEQLLVNRSFYFFRQGEFTQLCLNQVQNIQNLLRALWAQLWKNMDKKYLDKRTSALVPKRHGHNDSESSQPKRAKQDSHRHVNLLSLTRVPLTCIRVKKFGRFGVYLSQVRRLSSCAFEESHNLCSECSYS